MKLTVIVGVLSLALLTGCEPAKDPDFVSPPPIDNSPPAIKQPLPSTSYGIHTI